MNSSSPELEEQPRSGTGNQPGQRTPTAADADAGASSNAGTPRGGYYNPAPSDATPPVRVLLQEVHDDDGSRLETTIDYSGSRGASSMSSVFTLCNSAVGAGVLSLPYAFQCAGAVGCLILCVIVAASEAFTQYVLAKFAERYSAHSYGSLIRKALGRKTSAMLSAILLVYLWGSCVAYLVIIGDTFSSLASAYIGPDSVWANRRGILLVVGWGALLPMCLPRNLSELEWISAAAVCGFMYTAGAVLVRGLQVFHARPNPWADLQLFNTDIQALYAVSIVVFGFNCHANVVSVFAELEHYPHRIFMRLPANPSSYEDLHDLAPRPRTYKLIGMIGVIGGAMSIITVGYMAVGYAGYLAYPLTVSSNILNSFPPDDIAMQVARAVIGLVVAGHFPLNHHPARAAWEDLADAMSPAGTTNPVAGRWTSAALTVLFVGSSVMTSLFVTDLGSVLHLIGGTAAAFMIFMLPGLLLMNAAIIKVTNSFGALSQLQAPEDTEDGGDSQYSVPLLPKKAGLRDAGLIYSPSKSWWAGLFLVMLAGLVMAVTLVTVLVDSD